MMLLTTGADAALAMLAKGQSRETGALSTHLADNGLVGHAH